MERPAESFYFMIVPTRPRFQDCIFPTPAYLYPFVICSDCTAYHHTLFILNSLSLSNVPSFLLFHRKTRLEFVGISFNRAVTWNQH